MLAKTGLFLAVKLQFCRLCHVPALRLTLSLQPWLCGAGITACGHVDKNAYWYSACLQPCETSMVCPNLCPELYIRSLRVSGCWYPHMTGAREWAVRNQVKFAVAVHCATYDWCGFRSDKHRQWEKSYGVTGLGGVPRRIIIIMKHYLAVTFQ
jgi:hypothetical protein